MPFAGAANAFGSKMNGKPVKVRTTIRIKYTLRDSKPDKKDNGAKIEKKK